MTNSTDAAADLYALAARLGVGLGTACVRAGVARSTPSRWRKGTQPRPHLVARLRAAILDLAAERGTLPRPEASTDSVARFEIAVMRASLARLEASLAESPEG